MVLILFLLYGQRKGSFLFRPVVGEGGFEFQTPWFIATSFNSLNYRPYFVSTRSIPQDTLQKKPDERCESASFSIKTVRSEA
ncbi:hypothetical protein POPTR_009G170670v4 [Populus trichocarpa]|uniref:Uncharacterized protein n=1 Tax=Populus trichocarpa TaxID=3694 RepID=A0ACC0SIU7_POPTR|nr:hypothetical protein POPTR_009G170670v4 [Populus trichocarpa]